MEKATFAEVKGQWISGSGLGRKRCSPDLERFSLRESLGFDLVLTGLDLCLLIA